MCVTGDPFQWTDVVVAMRGEHEWRSTVANRSIGQGCPSCANSGFSPTRDGFLYFLEHDDWEMFQIGITNVPQDRLGRHQSNGWTVRDLRGPMNGDLVAKLEDDALDALRRRGANLGRRGGTHRFDGYTESWTRESLTLNSLSQLVAWIYEDDE